MIIQKKFRIYGLLLCVLMGSSQGYFAYAAPTTAKYWNALKASDSLVRSSHTEWERVFTQLPNTHMDVERFAASAGELARQRGANSAEVESEIAAIFRQANLYSINKMVLQVVMLPTGLPSLCTTLRHQSSNPRRLLAITSISSMD